MKTVAIRPFAVVAAALCLAPARCEAHWPGTQHGVAENCLAEAALRDSEEFEAPEVVRLLQKAARHSQPSVAGLAGSKDKRPVVRLPASEAQLGSNTSSSTRLSEAILLQNLTHNSVSLSEAILLKNGTNDSVRLSEAQLDSNTSNSTSLSEAILLQNVTHNSVSLSEAILLQNVTNNSGRLSEASLLQNVTNHSVRPSEAILLQNVTNDSVSLSEVLQAAASLAAEASAEAGEGLAEIFGLPPAVKKDDLEEVFAPAAFGAVLGTVIGAGFATP